MKKTHLTEVTSTSPGYLFYCNSDNSDCSLVKNIGYYINDRNNIYSCSAYDSEVKCIKSEAESSCNTNTIGKIIFEENKNRRDDQEKFSICLNYEDSKDYKVPLTQEAGNYVVFYKEDNILGLSSNEYGIVEVKQNSVEFNNYESSMKYTYANKQSNYKVLNKGDNCPTDLNNNLLEYKCNKGICTQT